MSFSTLVEEWITLLVRLGLLDMHRSSRQMFCFALHLGRRSMRPFRFVQSNEAVRKLVLAQLLSYAGLQGSSSKAYSEALS